MAGRTGSRHPSRESGAAAVEHAGLIALIGLLALASLSAVRADPEAGTGPRDAVARRIACAPALAAPCRRDPLTAAYGRRLAGAVRALAPQPRAVRSPRGPLVPVDFRRCRRPSCAIAGRPGLTTSNRRITVFVSVRRSRGAAEISYWHYRPSLGWERLLRPAGAADLREGEAVPLPEDAIPRLVPLETFDGRNHLDFPAGEEAPWRWDV